MPPLALTTLLQRALPRLRTETRAVVSALGCFNGAAPPADDVAVLLGMSNRYQLARALRRDGLPSLEELTGWARVLYWMAEAQGRDMSLRQLALRAGLDTATAYRLVQRVTGHRWSELRRDGMAAVVLELQKRCRASAAAVAADTRGPGRSRLGPAAVPPVLRLIPSPRSRPAAPRHPTPVLRARLPVAGNPFDVTIASDDTALVTRVHAAAVDRVLLAPLQLAGSIHTGAVPTRVVRHDASGHAYVTNQFTEDIGIIDLQHALQVGTIPVPGHPMAAELSPDGRTLFVATNLDRVCAVSLTARRIVTSVPVPQVCTELALDRSGTHLYVPTWRAGSIMEIAVPGMRPIRSFRVGGRVQGVCVTLDGRTLFAANEDGWVDVIQLCTGTLLKRLPLGSPAFGVAVSPDDAVVYVSLLRAGRVLVLDRDTCAVRSTLTPGGRPRRIAFDASGRVALIANEAGWIDLVG
jgi:DNA-binding beta-propeller fold protein YncE